MVIILPLAAPAKSHISTEMVFHPACLFGSVQRLVHFVHQEARVGGIGRDLGNSHAVRDRDRTPLGHHRRVDDGGTDPVSYLPGILVIRLREQDDDFIAALTPSTST